MSDPEYYKWDGTPVTNFRLDDGSFVPVLPIPKEAEYALTNYMECFPELDVSGWEDRSPDLCFKEGVAVGMMESNSVINDLVSSLSAVLTALENHFHGTCNGTEIRTANAARKLLKDISERVSP